MTRRPCPLYVTSWGARCVATSKVVTLARTVDPLPKDSPSQGSNKIVETRSAEKMIKYLPFTLARLGDKRVSMYGRSSVWSVVYGVYVYRVRHSRRAVRFHLRGHLSVNLVLLPEAEAPAALAAAEEDAAEEDRDDQDRERKVEVVPTAAGAGKEHRKSLARCEEVWSVIEIVSNMIDR